MRVRPLLLLALLTTACPPRPSSTDAGPSDAAAAPRDASVADAAIPDAATPDAAISDAAVLDAAIADAAIADAATADAASDDAGSTDASIDDAGTPDASVGDASMPDAGPGPDGGGRSPGIVRMMAANLTSGLAQSYDPGHGLRIMQGLRPDIVMIQEFNYGDGSDSAIRGFVDQACGVDCVYTREPYVVGNIPNGVVSRFPIVESGAWDDAAITNREFAWARIDVPGDRDLWAVSVHLKSSSASRATRTAEAMQLVGYIDAHVPPGDLLVVGGDLNTYDAMEPAFGVFASVLVVMPFADDGTGNTGTSTNRLVPGSLRQPYDQVMPDPDLDALEVPVVIGGNAFPNGLVFDSRVYTPLADVAPVQFDDSGAPNMQHMAVVRDFAFPAP